MEITVDNLQTENNNLHEVLAKQQDEISRMKNYHDSNLEKFDQKFDEIHIRLKTALDENLKLTEHI